MEWQRQNPRPETGVGNFNKTQIDMKNKFETLSDSKFMVVSDQEKAELKGGVGPSNLHYITHILTHIGGIGHTEPDVECGGPDHNNGYENHEDAF